MANEAVKSNCFYPADIVLQEQAKYVVFIKELQKQVRTLEDFRSRVLQAFPHLDIGFFMAKLSSAAKRQQKSSSTTTAAAVLPSLTHNFSDEPSKLTTKKCLVRAKTKKQRNVVRLRKFSDYERSETTEADSNEVDLSNETNSGVRSKLDGSCVTHRTDSGFSTDGKPVRDESGTNRLSRMELDERTKSREDDDDELMNVLEIIEKRSLTVRSIVEHRMAVSSSKEEELLTEIDQLQLEKEMLAEKLLGVEMELKLYREEVLRLKDSLIESEVAKRMVEERLDAAIAEREQLGTKINRIHSRFVTKHSPVNVEPNFSLGTRSSAAFAAAISAAAVGTKLKVRVDRSKVSAILQESRALELQRQLLVLMVRGEVLKSRMEVQDRDWNLRICSLKQLEIQWQKDMESLKRGNNELQIKIQKISTELRMERTKRKVLERALHAAYKDLTAHNRISSDADDVIIPRMTALDDDTPKATPVNFVPNNNCDHVTAGGEAGDERFEAAPWKWSYRFNTIPIASNGNHVNS
ncbi:hypothetical protein CHUAL_008915 [Chamberlinius hualienensis]